MSIDVELDTRFAQIASAIDDAGGRVERMLAFEGEARIKNAMTSEKSGRIYQRGSSVHQASAPGEAPAVDTGAYLNSIIVLPAEGRGVNSQPGWEISTNAEQAAALEYGTSRIAPRPIWHPTADALQELMVDWMVDEINRALGE